MVHPEVIVPYTAVGCVGGQAGICISPIGSDVGIGSEEGHTYPNLRFPSDIPVGDFIL